ncbi:MAG: hypothetical protein ACE5GB_02660 [Acidimicrobiales bacterium]
MSDEPRSGDDTDEVLEIAELLAALPPVEPRPGALERIVAAVAVAPGAEVAASETPGVVVELSRRRRWQPRIAAVAASVIIIAAVVGGLGGNTRIPAIGELVARHEAAAADQMPAAAEPTQVDPTGAPALDMPDTMTMTAAFHEGATVHLVYRHADGGAVSVFRQPGEPDLEDLPADGEMSMMGDMAMWTSLVAGRHVTVLDGTGYVWTVVSAPHDDTMMAAMPDDLPTRSPSLIDRVRDAVDALVEPWRFGT